MNYEYGIIRGIHYRQSNSFHCNEGICQAFLLNNSLNNCQYSMIVMQLEEFFSPSLSIEEKYNRQILEWKQQIMTSFQGILYEIPNCIIGGETTDLFVTKGRRQIAFFFDQEENDDDTITTIENDILCIHFSLQSDIFQIINKVMKILKKRTKSYFHQAVGVEDDTKYYQYLDEFWEDSVFLSNDHTLTKRELSAYFRKWSDIKCVKISSRILFKYMNEKMGNYQNGWKHYKLNYGITEDDFDCDA
jgi:hypothetical protein